MSSAGLAQGSRGCCPEKPAPPWPRALPSAPPEPLGSAWALGGARSPHRPSPLAPITLLCVHVSGMEKGPGLEDGPLLPHPGEGTSLSWNVKGNNSVQGGWRQEGPAGVGEAGWRPLVARRRTALTGPRLRRQDRVAEGSALTSLPEHSGASGSSRARGPRRTGLAGGSERRGPSDGWSRGGWGSPQVRAGVDCALVLRVCCGGHRSPRRDGGLPGAPEALLVPELPWPGAPAWGPHGPVFTDTRLPVSPVPNTRRRSHGHGQTLWF